MSKKTKSAKSVSQAKGKKKYVVVSNDGCVRGALAAALLKQEVKDASVTLAGLFTVAGQKADTDIEKLLQKNRLGKAQVPVKVTDALLEEADQVIALSIENKNYLKHSYDVCCSKISVWGISTVINRTPRDYQEAFGEIQSKLDCVVSCL